MERKHAMPFGAECLPNGNVRFRLWAPKAHSVGVSLSDGDAALPMTQQNDGWYELTTSEAKDGSLYQYQIGAGLKVPDPASRFQPQDVHGPSEVINPSGFEWQDSDWRGRPWKEAVIYELHVGTFSPEGTFAGVEKKLDYLVDLGITAIELMPLSDFSGKRNWGYDGVLPFAPDSSYGRPDDLKHLIQSAHAKGMMVFLDVVYNHFGPDGNYLREYSPEFFTNRHSTPWGDGINFDGEKSRTVRDFFLNNALYWLEEYHFDGLRLDAVHAILDDCKPDILEELGEVVRKKFGSERHVHLILENGDNQANYLERDQNQNVRWFDAQWNDDIHHALHVLITGEHDGYYSDYSEQPLAQLGRCLTQGFAYQGEPSEYHNAPRGEPSRHLPPTAFVSFLQNHDQIGNRAFGDRILDIADPQALRAAVSILLLATAPPLLFMGEEFGAKTPFLFFCDFEGDLAKAVTEGRRNEFARFAKFSSEETRSQIPDPNAEETFTRSKLDWTTINEPLHHNWSEFYRTLLTVRREQIIPHLMNKPCAKFTVHETTGLIVNWKFGVENTTLTLVANLGASIIANPQRPIGELICTNTEAVTEAWNQKDFPAWSVAWFLNR
ncbi:MAG: malto-oligosyltrehalose trehalohydrolase [Acidobacteriaceae bacterium]|jgi:maltooligosyltrehalose trehalohydrolase|nr:malto-oligosyltrehalose trehalohydrolase [Acidobacteriaceae bacterium]